MENTTYFAHIDKAEGYYEKEGNSEAIYLEFHCLEEIFVFGILGAQSRSVHREIQKRDEQVIVLNSSYKVLSTFCPFLDQPSEREGDWVIVRTNHFSGLPAVLYTGNSVDGVSVYISSITRLADEDPLNRFLKEKISLDDFEGATEEELIEAFQSHNLSSAEFVAVYNVGQGNCNAICDDSSVPLLYFDLGGGCYANRRTYPNALGFCFTANPAILLSHWDTDHYQSAKLNSTYLSKSWIVPRQTIGPVHLKFFLSITGTRLIWPTGIATLNFSRATIIVCTGNPRHKNHSGLALKTQLSPAVNTIREVLLPGDAAYTYIPTSCAPQSFHGLVATHHGAEFHVGNNPVPTPAGARAIAYSFGNGNTYNHPKLNATNAHAAIGWGLPYIETQHGHIALSDCPHGHPLGCGGAACQLHITQTY